MLFLECVGASETEEKNYQHSSSSHPCQGEATVCTGMSCHTNYTLSGCVEHEDVCLTDVLLNPWSWAHFIVRSCLPLVNHDPY
jgi:hypothetical protein